MAFVRYVPFDQGAAGTLALAAAVAGQRHKVLGFMMSPASAGTRSFRFSGSASGTLTGPITIQSGGLPTLSPGPIPFCETAPGEILQLVTTGAGFKGIVVYVTEP